MPIMRFLLICKPDALNQTGFVSKRENQSSNLGLFLKDQRRNINYSEFFIKVKL